ncbi:unnamed protein product [Arctogadus glacialis]
MGLFLDPLASVNNARRLHGTAADPTLASGGGFNCKDYKLVNKGCWFIGGHTSSRNPTEVNKNSLIQTIDGLLPSVS